jgi:DNA-binding transcriptional regulator YiaG
MLSHVTWPREHASRNRTLQLQYYTGMLSSTEAMMATRTAHNLELEEIGAAANKLGLTKAELATILGVDYSTLYRWLDRESTPRGMAISRIHMVQDIFESLRSVFDGPDLAQTWLRNAKPATLGGQITPLECMVNGRPDKVLNTLDFITRGT